MPLRQPIVVVLGHVDHGKTTLLDAIRGTTVAKREPGQITQWIGASLIPAEILKETCEHILERFKFEVKVPGILFIDTPGHETFSNLRRRGGSAADIAVLVVDIAQGIQPQTLESIDILRSRKTPFVVAANKIDLIKGWVSKPQQPFEETLKLQAAEIQTELDNRIYSLIGGLSKLGFSSERFDRVSDFTKSLAIVPVSAKSGEGIPELLAIIAGITQTFMRNELEASSGPARGTVLEVTEEPGLGVTVNTIIYDGVLRVNDTIVLGGRQGPLDTKVRALLVPHPLDEIRDPREKFTSVDRVTAAAGVKIAAPGIDSALAGSPLYGVPKGKHIKEHVRLVEEEVDRVRIKTDRIGVILKADALGSLEAITALLAAREIPVRLADVGDVSRREVIEAVAVASQDRLYGVVLAFNVKVLPDAEQEANISGVRLFSAQVIYHLMEDYTRWIEEQRAAGVKAQLEILIRPGKVRVLPGFVFRRSKPAVVGIEVSVGRIRPKYPLITIAGKFVGEVKQIQDQGKNIDEATVGMRVAASIDKAVVGRNLNEGDELYVDIPEKHVKILQSRLTSELSPPESSLISDIIQIKRRENPIWAM